MGWLDELGASGADKYVAFIVTDWQALREAYAKAMCFLDSSVFGGEFRVKVDDALTSSV